MLIVRYLSLYEPVLLRRSSVSRQLFSIKPIGSAAIVRYCSSSLLHEEMMKSKFAPKDYDPSKMTKAQFWSEHEKNRKRHHEMKRNEFITEKHSLLIIYCAIGFAVAMGYYYFMSDFSFGDQSALHYKAVKRIVFQSPIARSVLGNDLVCFGIYGRRKQNPFYKVQPMNDSGSRRMLEIKFHAKGELGHGIIYAEAYAEGARGSLKFKKVQLITDDEIWDLRKPTEVTDLTSLY